MVKFRKGGCLGILNKEIISPQSCLVYPRDG